jgi:hypothetical protein
MDCGVTWAGELEADGMVTEYDEVVEEEEGDGWGAA